MKKHDFFNKIALFQEGADGEERRLPDGRQPQPGERRGPHPRAARRQGHRRRHRDGQRPRRRPRGHGLQERQGRVDAHQRQPDMPALPLLHHTQPPGQGPDEAYRLHREDHRNHGGDKEDSRQAAHRDARLLHGLQVDSPRDGLVRGQAAVHRRRRGELRLPGRGLRARQGRRVRLLTAGRDLRLGQGPGQDALRRADGNLRAIRILTRSDGERGQTGQERG